MEVEGWLDPATSVAEADTTGRLVAERLSAELPEMRSFVWAARSAQPV
ncbi:hypothetical protein NIIDMKKI_26630 [Mycobacterium kansasii]|uniref:Uncharacterized protein n=1 Tax=Mycobacterium kansasii TaxID=1768 RepID=A0A7G1I926_MYCKA|nr:hypothetical protein NIIDMKKI_26630 [Mycobacterium kansasii]